MSEEHYISHWRNAGYEQPSYVVNYGNDSLSSPSSSWLYIW